MVSSLVEEFHDIKYQEYEGLDGLPYETDLQLDWSDTTVMPVKRKREPQFTTGPNPRLVIKRIRAPDEQSFNDHMKRLILREARCLNYAKHRHIIRFETAFYLESQDESRSFMGIVMDRAEGDIRAYLKCQMSSEKNSKICGWFQCLSNAVAYVHGLGITHRDIKPPNILVKDGKVLLADFGISKLGLVKTLPTTQPNDPRSRTPQYAAPEVEDGSTRGRSADIFSLGAVFLEMLVAYSYPTERQSLSSVIHLSPNDSSYAKRLNDVHLWMTALQQRMTPEEAWQNMIICTCQDMLSPDRDERPSIESVYQRIKSVPSPSNSTPTCCSLMLEGEDVTDDQRLVEACKSPENIDEVRELVSSKRGDPRTVGVLHQASAHGSDKVVEYLLSQGAPVDLRDYSNQTALHCAAGYGHKTTVEILLKKRADVNVRDDEGRTPLFYASGHGNADIVSKLLMSKAQVVTQDHNRQTALHFAAKGRRQSFSNHIRVIELLLGRAADINARDAKGRTPQEYAKSKGHDHRASLLGNDAPGSILVQDKSLTDPSSMTVKNIARIIQPPRQYCDDDIQQVADQLKDVEPGLEQYTKICIVLHNSMQSTDDVYKVLKRFSEKKTTDHRLPFKKEELIDVLDSPGALARFEKEQQKVLIDTPTFQKLDTHYNLRQDQWRGSLKEIGVLGQGDSGVVYKVGLGNSDQIYALKTIERSKRKAGEELAMLKRASHKNIVRLVGSFTSPQFIGILMDPAADYNLAMYLDESTIDPQKESLLLRYFGCLVDALSYLHHEVYVRHNDIKPQNILVHRGQVFLADFGISLDWKETMRTTTWAPAARTPLYCAPEVTREGQSRNSTADIWSLGCVFLEMMTVLKGRHVKEISTFLGDRGSRGSSYGERLSDVLLWIRILEEENNDITNEPFEWIHDMLQHEPKARPGASRLRKILQEKSDSNAGLSFFGDCCRRNTVALRERNDSRQLEEIFDDSPIEKDTRIAAVGWSGERRLYIQGTDGGIREAARKQYGSSWEGGRPEDKIAKGKLRTPIAATAWQQIGGHRQPVVRVYFLDNNDLIQERSWNPVLGWTDGALSRHRIQAAPTSELAVTSWGDGNIILCYQDIDNSIRILHGWAPRSEWRRGSILRDEAAIGSPLAAINFEHLGHRGLRLYCKFEEAEFGELCWDKVEDEGRENPDPYRGGYSRTATPGSSITAVAFKQVDLEMFIYYSSPADGIIENRYSGGWLGWDTRVGNGTLTGPISALRLENGSMAAYFVDGSNLMEVVREDGNWSQTVIMASQEERTLVNPGEQPGTQPLNNKPKTDPGSSESTHHLVPRLESPKTPSGCRSILWSTASYFRSIFSCLGGTLVRRRK
ncbi:kinase-like domain-containing protein [Hypoxylon trugodes]|uniref:kinase-like domain-containing protein n=1 Tax=Hypoxylon trugodes TaxID=326681 RepID=UPI002192A140|nr:kinase-like domain-containing protein [Hypoxylon trugodes]KAI1392941.1 kinase-like domain-containing protein [Hypoxylon trugodes]